MEHTFSGLGIEQETLERLSGLGITEPTPVQEKVIPMIASGDNLMFQSETGTGKTFAYLLPLLRKLKAEENPQRNVRILIASPTYELASQIKIQAQAVSRVKCALCIGGAPISRQIEALREKPEIVVGGPSRILELIHLKKLKADHVEVLVLDEADRLLSKELRESTQLLMERLPASVQIIGNSATVSEYTRAALEKARGRILSQEDADESASENDARAIKLVTMPQSDVLREKIEHWAIFAERRQKIDTLRSFIHAAKPEKLLVFTGRKDQVEIITGKLLYKKIDCMGLSAGTDKVLRKSAIDRFRSGKLKVLVTTDLASRGLDIPGISHVVQMDLPSEKDFFIHRAGRTARAGKTGVNCVIGDEFEMRSYAALEKQLGIKVHPKEIRSGKITEPLL